MAAGRTLIDLYPPDVRTEWEHTKVGQIVTVGGCLLALRNEYCTKIGHNGPALIQPAGSDGCRNHQPGDQPNKPYRPNYEGPGWDRMDR